MTTYNVDAQTMLYVVPLYDGIGFERLKAEIEVGLEQLNLSAHRYNVRPRWEETDIRNTKSPGTTVHKLTITVPFRNKTIG